MPKWLLYSLLSLPINGVWGLILSPASKILTPLQIQAFTACGFVPLIIIFALRGNLTRGSRPCRGAGFAFAAGLCSSLANVTTYAALAEGGEASTVITIASTYPLVTLLLAGLFLGERFNLIQAVGIFIALSAIYAFNAQADGGTASGAGTFGSAILSRWMAITLLALFLNGLAGVLLKVATSAASTELSSLCLSASCVGFALVTVLTQKIGWNIPAKGCFYGAAVAALGALGLVVMMPAYRWGKASVVTALTSLYPAVTVVLAAPILGEGMSAAKGISVGLALTAGVALSYERARPPAVRPREEAALPGPSESSIVDDEPSCRPRPSGPSAVHEEVRDG
jgi:drug/metabolite transporter (DMT)-like permease